MNSATGEQQSGPRYWAAARWTVLIGLVQCVPAIVLLARSGTDAGESERLAWFGAPAIGGAVYLLVAVPLALRMQWAVVVSIIAAGAQVIAFALLAMLSIVAAARSGEPGAMTMGVLVFGSLGCMHVFVITTLWPIHRSKP